MRASQVFDKKHVRLRHGIESVHFVWDRLKILSLALRLQPEGHAALSAQWQDASRNEAAGSGETRGAGICGSSHGECVHAGLRGGRRRPCSAPVASSYPTTYQRGGDAGDCGGGPGKYAGFCGHGNQHDGHERFVERQRGARR